MGKATGFLEFARVLPIKESATSRVNHSHEFVKPLSMDELKQQSSRCMNCGIPFCQNGCPLGNLIPDFNDAVYTGNQEKALNLLLTTNNFPEFTGRVCPAPCESACVLDINKEPVVIEEIEKSIIEYGFANGLIKPRLVKKRTDKYVAVIGSGPAGLAVADKLNQLGHNVTVYERADKIGGLLRYGIPDFKLEKNIIDRRLMLLATEGIKFSVNANIGHNIDVTEQIKKVDAIILTVGATKANHLEQINKSAPGVCLAMDYLTQHNQIISNSKPPLYNHAGEKYPKLDLTATNKHVVIIGGGDTASDCIGTANRQKAHSVTQLYHGPQAPLTRCSSTPWPLWPRKLNVSSSHEEGCTRLFGTQLKELVIENDKLIGIKISELDFIKISAGESNATYQEVPDSERVIPCDLLILAIGFQVHNPLFKNLGISINKSGKFNTNDDFQILENPKVFIAGDIRLGASLVVSAIADGRNCAKVVNNFLTEKD